MLRMKVNGWIRESPNNFAVFIGLRCKHITALFLEIFTRFPDTQRCHFFAAAFNIFPHPFGIRFAVIAQCPADSLVDKKFALPEVVIEDLGEQSSIGFFFAQ